jgi:LytS/YehU family sensor histidine kinase
MQAQIQNRYDNATVTTVKIISADLTLLSKISAFVRANFEIFSDSSVMVNKETGAYFMYLNIKNAEVAEKLKNITPYGSVNL